LTVGAAAVVAGRGEAAGWRERAPDPAGGATHDAHAVPVA